MKKITAKGVILGLFVGFVLGLIVSGLIAGAFTGAFVSVPKPEVKEGEFDFSLTYEVDGKTEKIEGTYVCKFEGTSRALDGVGRDWKGYIKDHDYSTDYEVKTTDKGTIMLNLDICAQFFMSDPFYKSNANTDDPKPEPYFYITSDNGSSEEETKEVFFDYYEGKDVKIISFEYDPPIENTYK